ncbi:uncharacterized protein LOC114528780 [Dendronephthya gigantea]|uniref:uncharacterized protein LOC114528780 n=1 Tax=Dendronephthya gigantea TaxID=151771 RepID=UPI00106A2702|nr:uncharacterized protein LOC114528780 [Dendronephthya gigantea]XP_028406298.1 uncharacterized protein LOC114528780 [Dendronephthya gigantea]
MSSKDMRLPRRIQASDRSSLVATVIRLHGYKVVQQSVLEKSINPELKTLLSVGDDIYHVCSPVFKIEDEAHVWKLKFEEYSESKESSEPEADLVFLGDIRFKTRKVDVTGDPNGSQLRQLCQKGILEDIQNVIKNSDFNNVLLNLCDVPYPRPEDLCDKTLSNALLKLQSVDKVLVVYPKIDAEDCGLESGLEGTWNRYLATDLVCLHWRKEECQFTKFEKKFLKYVVKNGLHDTQVRDVASLPESEQESTVDTTKTEGEITNEKEEEVKTEEKVVSEERKFVKKIIKKDEKSLKKEDKTIKKELIKKELKTSKSESNLKREPKLGRNTEQNAAKRNSKVFKPTDSRSLKNETSPRSTMSLKRDQKLISPKNAGDDRKASMKSETKTTKNGQKVTKKEPVPIPKTEATQPSAVVKENDENNFEKYKEKMRETYTNLTNAYKTYRNIDSPLLKEIFTHPVFRGFCLTMVLFAFYFLSTEILVTLLLLAASIWFKYGSKEPEFQKYTRSTDPRVLAFRGMYEREIEKLRYAKELDRMREVHVQLKESVLNAYAVTRVAQGDKIGIKEHEVLERELELTFKEFVTANDVKSLLHEAHHTSFILAFTAFLYIASRLVYLALGRLWRPVRTGAIILAGILLCFALCNVSNFLLTSFISRRLIGSAEMLSVVFGLWFVTDLTGYLIEIRACIDHVTGVIWRECDLERCIMKTPSYLVVKLALDCAVLLSLFPLAYFIAGVLSCFSVSSYTIVSVSRFLPPVGIVLRLCTRLAFLGEILRVANLIMFASLTSKFYGLHYKREDPLDSFLNQTCWL